jgi:transcriptional regulator with XRE-family HTH domain
MSNLKDRAKAFNKDMAAHLKTLRQEENETMRTLADILGTPHSFIGKIEQQSRRLDVAEFVIYCRALNKEPVEVLKKLCDDAKAK